MTDMTDVPLTVGPAVGHASDAAADRTWREASRTDPPTFGSGRGTHVALMAGMKEARVSSRDPAARATPGRARDFRSWGAARLSGSAMPA